MKSLNEKVAYLKGLVDGMELDTSVKQNRLIMEIIDILEDMAYSIEDIQDITDELYEDYKIDCSEDCQYQCPNCGELIDIEEKLIENGEQLICPECNEPIKVAIDYDEDPEE